MKGRKGGRWGEEERGKARKEGRKGGREGGREGGLHGLMLIVSHKLRNRIITSLTSPLYRGSYATNILDKYNQNLGKRANDP